MHLLALIASSKALLTKTDGADSFLCDLDGNRLPQGAPGLPIYRDGYSGKTYVRVAENIPTGNQTADKERKAEIEALNPIHFTSADGDVRGYFIEAPDFNEREAKAKPEPVAE
jgi:hypothetical protein